MRRASCWITMLVTLTAWYAQAAAQDPSNEIYREDRVATFRLTMSAASWNAICNDGAGVGDTWQRAEMTWQSDTVPGVGVKRSGVGTRAMDTQKPALRLSFNEFEFANPPGAGTPGRKWRGVNRIKLDSMVGNTDQAMMRDRVAYGIFRDAGAPAPRACHARLYVNGAFKGLFTVEEPIRDDFLQNRFGEESGNLYKSEGFDEFTWKGTAFSSYIPNPWIAESNYPGGDYRDLVELINIVNNYPAGEIRTRLSNHINLDGFLRHLAVEAVYGESDGFNNWGSGGANNHYWYHRASNNRMEVLKWDPGASQGMYDASNGFAKGQSPLGNAYNRSAITRWIQADATAWPTVKTKIRTILDGPMTGIQGRIDSIYNQIKSHAYEDPLKGAYAGDPAGFTDAEFDAAVTWLKDWYVRRIAYLRTQVGGATLPTVTIAATDPNASEPSSVGVFTVTRGGSTSASLAVSLSRTGTATSGSDYTGVGTSVTIAAGQGSATITATPVDDSLIEANETIILTIASGSGYTVGTPSSATVTLADNDTAPTPPTVTITASDPNAAEPSSVGAFTVTRTGSTGVSLAVSLSRTGTATSGSDYSGVGTSVTIAAGQNSATITLTPIDDTLVEGPETVILTIAANAAYVVGTASSATVTITDNDSAALPTVTITATDPNAAEPTSVGIFTVTRTGSSSAALSVVRARTGTATSGTDFQALPSPIIIPAGQASVTVTLTPIDDTVAEGNETVILTLSPNAAYTVGASSTATVTIADNDSALPTVTIAATDPNAAEPASVGVFTVSRTGSTVNPLTVVRARTGTATSGTDFQALPSPITIPAGQSSVTMTVTPIDDTAVEGNETIILTLSPDATYTVGAASSATVTIADNDTAGGGVSATYYDNPDFTGASVTRTDPTVDFNWADQSPAAGIGADTFSSRWTGRVRAQYSELYTFYTFTNDGVRLWVEGELLVDHWVQQSGGVEWSAQVSLQAGQQYMIQMDHYEGVGNAIARLSWSSPSIPTQVVPQGALDPALGVPDSRDNDGDGIPNDADLDDDNDGIPDLQDPDRDGDAVTNLAERAAGTDPNDRNSPGGGTGPVAASIGDNPNGDGTMWPNDKCAGGSIGTPQVPPWALLLLGLAFFARRKGVKL